MLQPFDFVVVWMEIKKSKSRTIYMGWKGSHAERTETVSSALVF
jgi:hypothetical protein